MSCLPERESPPPNVTAAVNSRKCAHTLADTKITHNQDVKTVVFHRRSGNKVHSTSHPRSIRDRHSAECSFVPDSVCGDRHGLVPVPEDRLQSRKPEGEPPSCAFCPPFHTSDHLGPDAELTFVDEVSHRSGAVELCIFKLSHIDGPCPATGGNAYLALKPTGNPEALGKSAPCTAAQDGKFRGGKTRRSLLQKSIHDMLNCAISARDKDHSSVRCFCRNGRVLFGEQEDDRTELSFHCTDDLLLPAACFAACRGGIKDQIW